MTRPVRYWDADVFIGWLAEEDDKLSLCEPVLEAAKAGKLLIATSVLTLTEVIKLKSKTKLPPEKWELARTFFDHDWIALRSMDQFIAESARELIWNFDLSQGDAIHIATATRYKLTQMDTFDKQLIGLSGKIGNPLLVISNPNLPPLPTPLFFP